MSGVLGISALSSNYNYNGQYFFREAVSEARAELTDGKSFIKPKLPFNPKFIMPFGLVMLGIIAFRIIKPEAFPETIEELLERLAGGNQEEAPIRIIDNRPERTPKEKPIDCVAEWEAVYLKSGWVGICPTYMDYYIMFSKGLMVGGPLFDDAHPNHPFYSNIKRYICRLKEEGMSRDCAIEMTKRILELRGRHEFVDKYNLSEMYDRCGDDKNDPFLKVE